MKNKKLLYILIPATLALWGAILYKIVVGVNGKEEAFPINQMNAPVENNETLPDTFNISGNYRDPFIAGKKEKVNSNTGEIPVTKIKVAAPVAISQWPNIVYGGMIKNQQSSKQLVLILINGQSNFMKMGDIANGIELTKVFRDSIEVQFLKEKKFISKKIY